MGINDNKVVVRRFVEEIPNLGNLEAAGEVLANDFVLHFPNMPAVEGADAFKKIPSMIRAAFPDLNETIVELVAEGDKVVERFTLQGTHLGDFMGIAPTGRAVSWSGIAIYRLDGGKIVECWVEANLLGLLLQLGMLPPLGPLLK
jgi:steroid delta-isomerase-like uncharacterized protein